LASGLLCVFLTFSSCSSRQDAGTASGASHNATPTVDAVKVIARKLETTVRLLGELQAYEVVSVFPKTAGFVDSIPVDRGSRVKKGDLIARLVAPEVTSQRVEAEAQLAADEGTYRRLKAAAATPGVLSGNELEIAEKTVEADRAHCKALRDSERAARAALRSIEEIEGYLQVRAPFDGVDTERNVHPGALVAPQGGAGVTVPIVRIETVARLRLVVAVPESDAAAIPGGTKVNFTVPAFPGAVFQGTAARIAHSLDVRTRTMPVELDVNNPALKLAPGWCVSGGHLACAAKGADTLRSAIGSRADYRASLRCSHSRREN
jgi:RND family efflux transporter MFP subunit